MAEKSVVDEPKSANKKKSVWWLVLIAILLFAGAAYWGWNIAQEQKAREQKQKNRSDELSKVLTAKDKDLQKAQTALLVCEGLRKGQALCGDNKKRKRHYHTPKPSKLTRTENPSPKMVSTKLTAEQMVAACDPLPIVSDGHGGWKCVSLPPQQIAAAVKEVAPKEPDVYYPAVFEGEEESSLPTANHALGCAGVGALGGLAVEGNGRGAVRGALVAVVGDLIGTAVGGRTGGNIGCGIGTVGNMVYRHNRGGNNLPPPPVMHSPPIPAPGATANPGLPGATLN